MTADESGPALFEVGEARPARAGDVAAEFDRLVTAAREAGKLVDEDAALIAGVRVLAESLDTAHRVGGLKGGYLAAQAFPPYQRGLHALRLPVELTAVSQPGTGTGGGVDTADSFRELFGTPE